LLTEPVECRLTSEPLRRDSAVICDGWCCSVPARPAVREWGLTRDQEPGCARGPCAGPCIRDHTPGKRRWRRRPVSRGPVARKRCGPSSAAFATRGADDDGVVTGPSSGGSSTATVTATAGSLPPSGSTPSWSSATRSGKTTGYPILARRGLPYSLPRRERQ